MSSAPSGLDVREYAYGVYNFVAPDALTHIIDARKRWAVTKIQFFAAAGTSAAIAIGADSVINVAAGGCLTLEPNGAFRENIQVAGNGCFIVIEFWFQAIAGAFVPVIPITVT